MCDLMFMVVVGCALDKNERIVESEEWSHACAQTRIEKNLKILG